MLNLAKRVGEEPTTIVSKQLMAGCGAKIQVSYILKKQGKQRPTHTFRLSKQTTNTQKAIVRLKDVPLPPYLGKILT